MSTYLPAKETVEAANNRNLSVGDYLEELLSIQGTRQTVIHNLKELKVFNNANNILEIGPGSGMFLEKVLEICNPQRYEIYEIAEDWIEYLRSQYGDQIISQPADSKTLYPTPSASIDLIHSHGVFVYLRLLTSYSYFLEMARVIRPSGFVVFDIFDEKCLTDDIMEKWLNSKYNYPCFLGNDYVKNLFTSRGFVFISDFFNIYEIGISHYLVFQKNN